MTDDVRAAILQTFGEELGLKVIRVWERIEADPHGPKGQRLAEHTQACRVELVKEITHLRNICNRYLDNFYADPDQPIPHGVNPMILQGYLTQAEDHLTRAKQMGVKTAEILIVMATEE